MSYSAALVPAPFYAPVRTDTGSLPAFDKKPRRLRRLPMPERLPPPPHAEGGLIYGQDGCLVADGTVGSRVDVYA